LAQTEFDAAVLFDFNTGAIGYATWVKKFNAGDRAGAVVGIMSWTIPASIKARRKKEQMLFDKGVYSNGGKGTIYETDGKGHVIWSSGKVIDLRPLVDGPAKLPPAPQLIIPIANAKPVQPSLTPSATKPKAAPPPVNWWAGLRTFLHL
jgi:hypothetical protein